MQQRQVHLTHAEAALAPKVGCLAADARPAPLTRRTPASADSLWFTLLCGQVREFATTFDYLLSAQICGPTCSPPAVSACVEFDTPVALRHIAGTGTGTGTGAGTGVM